MSQRCVYGECKAWAIKGGTVCNKHGGARRDVAANAAVRAEVLAWRLGDALDDPGETLLRLITQSRRRADAYADELDQLVKDTDLRKALVGDTYIAAGEDGAVKSGEYIRGLAQLEAQERDRCASFCVKAIAAGLAERVVRIQERQAAQSHAALVAGLDEAGVVGDVRKQVLAGAARHLRLVAS